MRSVFFAFFLILSTIYQILHTVTPVLALDIGISDKINISAAIPSTTLTLYGYTSPSSKVELSGITTYASTLSLPNGYFEFATLILPRPLDHELCLSTLDHQNRRSASICIPAPPEYNYTTSIGPIIIPPTLSLDKASIKPGETIITSGATIPNVPVKIYFFQRDTKAPVFPPEVQAFSLPPLTAQSDDQGNYSFNLPTATATNYRLFTAALFDSQYPSPKSNTLYFTLPSLGFNFYLLLIPFFILSLTLFIWLTIRYYRSTRYLPALYQKSLILK